MTTENDLMLGEISDRELEAMTDQDPAEVTCPQCAARRRRVKEFCKQCKGTLLFSARELKTGFCHGCGHRAYATQVAELATAKAELVALREIIGHTHSDLHCGNQWAAESRIRRAFEAIPDQTKGGRDE